MLLSYLRPKGDYLAPKNNYNSCIIDWSILYVNGKQLSRLQQIQSLGNEKCE